MRTTNALLPQPSSAKDLLCENEYLDNVSRKLKDERDLSYSGSRVVMGQKGYKSVVLDSWNQYSSADMRKKRLALLNFKI